MTRDERGKRLYLKLFWLFGKCFEILVRRHMLRFGNDDVELSPVSRYTKASPRGFPCSDFTPPPDHSSSHHPSSLSHRQEGARIEQSRGWTGHAEGTRRARTRQAEDTRGLPLATMKVLVFCFFVVWSV